MVERCYQTEHIRHKNGDRADNHPDNLELTTRGVQVERTIKRCPACGSEKPITLFFRNRSNLDGYEYECKDCRRESVRRSRRKHADKVRKQKRRWNLANSDLVKAKAKRYRKRYPEKIREYTAKYYRRNREKYAARIAVQRAIKAGQITRPDRCECCGGVRKLNAHHADYSKVLEVKFLCHRCHGEEHLKIAALGAVAAEKPAPWRKGTQEEIDRLLKTVEGNRQLRECDMCDGCGWHEGGKAIQTGCEKCGGTGVLVAGAGEGK